MWIHYLPILTTVVAAWFAVVLFRRWGSRGGRHLLWWGIGVVVYGLGTLTEAWTTLFGWHPVGFRAWYISGALLGGAPLATGTAYLLLRERTADRLAIAVFSLVTVAAACVVLSPLNVSQAEAHRLSGRVLEWQWVRGFSPFINTYAVVFLIGGAVLSAVRYFRRGDAPERVRGNTLIALGAILPGIGGSFTRLGYVEVLYVTELVGILLILSGYHLIVSVRSVTAPPAPLHSPAASPSLPTRRIRR